MVTNFSKERGIEKRETEGEKDKKRERERKERKEGGEDLCEH